MSRTYNIRNCSSGRAVKEAVKELHSRDAPSSKSSSECQRYKASWGSQFRALVERSWLCVVREPGVFYIRVLKNLVSYNMVDSAAPQIQYAGQS